MVSYGMLSTRIVETREMKEKREPKKKKGGCPTISVHTYITDYPHKLYYPTDLIINQVNAPIRPTIPLARRIRKFRFLFVTKIQHAIIKKCKHVFPCTSRRPRKGRFQPCELLTDHRLRRACLAPLFTIFPRNHVRNESIVLVSSSFFLCRGTLLGVCGARGKGGQARFFCRRRQAASQPSGRVGGLAGRRVGRQHYIKSTCSNIKPTFLLLLLLL